MKIKITPETEYVLNRLAKAGYEAYLVGGLVRDALIGEAEAEYGDYCAGAGSESGGRKLLDIDVTTSARPEQVKDVFADLSVIETGIKHGTVTVLVPAAGEKMPTVKATDIDHVPVEITTYRSDGTYSNNRHPDSVEFVTSLEEDVKRRDFTINALVADASGEVHDLVGGLTDLANYQIRTVGNPDERFREDALRIMRGIRFAAVTGFDVEPETEAAIHRNKGLLGEVSAERLFVEFKKLVDGPHAGIVIRRYKDVLGVLIPEILEMDGFDQHNSYHKYDVLEHCVRALEVVDTEAIHVKIAALLHDVGKPETYFMDENGIGHFYGHPKAGAPRARAIMERFKADAWTTDRVETLVKYHDMHFELDEKIIKRRMNKLGVDVVREVLEIKHADNIATGNMAPELGEKFAQIKVMIDVILASDDCFQMKDLAINGNDLIKAGIKPGPEMGKLLELALDAVIDEEVPNERECLLEFVAQNR